MRLRLRVPRPAHSEADPDEQEAWKKKLQQQVERIQSEHPNAAVEVWSEDEHRIGLHPTVRRIWVEEGEPTVAVVNWKREWLWLYAFVQPQTGETYWWILPYVNTSLFSRVLKDFAQHFGVGKNKRIILPPLSSCLAYERAVAGTRRHSRCVHCRPILQSYNQPSACGPW